MARPVISREQYIKNINKIYGYKEFEILIFTGTQDPVTLRHAKCGYIWKTRANSFYGGGGCPFCSHRISYRNEYDIQYNLDLSYGYDQYIVKSKPKNGQITVEHIPCHTEFTGRMMFFTYGNHICPICNDRRTGMPRKFENNKEFAKYFKEKYSPKYILESEYDGRTVCMVDIRHNDPDCNQVSTLRAGIFLKNPRCSYCLRNKDLYAEYAGDTPVTRFKKFIKDRYNDEYELVEGGIVELTHNNRKLTFKHKSCGNVFKKTKDMFLHNDYPCPKCHKNYMKLKRSKIYNTMFFKKKLKTLHKNDFEIIENYRYQETPIKLKHSCEDGKFFIFDTTPRGITNNLSCPRCRKRAIQQKYINDRENRVRKSIKKRYKDSYEILDFNHYTKKLILRHKKCGNIFCKLYKSFLEGSDCALCASRYASKGEQFIAEILSEHNIIYFQQKTFKNLLSDKNGRLLFDFYLPKQNILIEYDGEQHYAPSDYFGGEVGFIQLKSNDKLKNNYAKRHKIRLLRIPYTIKKKENIEKHIAKELRLWK